MTLLLNYNMSSTVHVETKNTVKLGKIQGGGGCRGLAKIWQGGGGVAIFLKFLRDKNITF